MLDIISFFCKKQVHTPVLTSVPHLHGLWITCEEREKKLLPGQAVETLSQAKASPLWRQAQVVQRRLSLKNNYSVGRDRKEKRWANTEEKLGPNLKKSNKPFSAGSKSCPQLPLGVH